MNDRSRINAKNLWLAVYPMILYDVIQGAAALLLYGILFFMEEAGIYDSWVYDESMILTVLAGTLVSIPLFGWIYRRDVERRRMNQWSAEEPGLTEGQFLWVAAASISAAILGNNVVGLLPLGDLADSYQETSEALYAGSIWLRMLTVGLCAPIAEELIMRGILYGRFREMMRPSRAIFFSALLFGIFHGNIVQGIYAFLMGLFFAWLMERFQTILAPAAAHICANLAVVILEDSGAPDVMYGTFGSFLLVTAASAVIFVCAFRMLKSNG